MFYVYEWYKKGDNEVIYVGKGTRNRWRNKNRNKLFNLTLKKYECDSRIVRYFYKEEEALKYEALLIDYYQQIGQCKCNICKGGYGGLQSVWTQEKRKEWGDRNPMKSIQQRERMRANNPMSSPTVAKKVGNKHKKVVIINGQEFIGVKEASKILGVHEATITRWCKRGYDTNYNPCRYGSTPQKDYTIKKTNSKKIIIDNTIYNSVREGANAIGVWPESIIQSIKNNRPCKGHVCKYVNQQPS